VAHRKLKFKQGKVFMLIPGCVACDIVAGKLIEPGGVIYENDYWHVGSAVSFPFIWPGFLIIKLKRHCDHLAELSSEEAVALGPVIQSTCLALAKVLHPAKVYVCSFGDGVKHVHFWLLPRPSDMRPGMHSVMFNLDMRRMLTRLLGMKKWIVPEEDVITIAKQVRECLCEQMSRH
jgi:diadenosine tetraphosphate (Ap4A) HIT family hydrolase